MSTPFFTSQRYAMLDLLAPAIGCKPADFESGGLTIVERPADMPWYAVLGVKVGVGVVLSVEPSLLESVRKFTLDKPTRALRPMFMQRIVDQCSTPERKLFYQVPSICWALQREPEIPPTPAGYALDRVDSDWMAKEVTSGNWDNGIGQFESDGRNFRNQYGFVARDTLGAPVAVAGVFETYGMLETGVDVLPDHQRKGLAPLVVMSAARSILEEGQVPLYGCAADNIRSQRTALASGFLPAYVDAAVGWGMPAAAGA